MKATTLTYLSVLWVASLNIFPVLAVRPGKEPDLQLGSDSPASKNEKPLSKTAGIGEDADITEVAPLQCAHLVFNMTGPVYLSQSDSSSSGETNCLKVCDKKFRDKSKLGFSGLSTIAHRKKWTKYGVISGCNERSMRFSDTCQASGRICVGVLEASDITADYRVSTNRQGKANFAQRTCMSTQQMNSACASETTPNPLVVGCMCKVRFQLYNSYVGYGATLPADLYPGRRYDCRPSSICQRLQDARYLGWFCQVDSEVPVECPHIRYVAKYTRLPMLNNDHNVCKCNKYGSRSCEEFYSQVIELRSRALMPPPDLERSQQPRHRTEDLMQTHSQMAKALNEIEQVNHELRLQLASIDAQIAQYSSSSQSMGAPPTLQELAPAQHIEASPSTAQIQANSPQSVPGETVLPFASPAARRCDAGLPASFTEQEQDGTITAVADPTYWGDLFYEDETPKYISEYLEYFGLPFL